jgi:hypothetical protein
LTYLVSLYTRSITAAWIVEGELEEEEALALAVEELVVSAAVAVRDTRHMKTPTKDTVTDILNKLISDK